MNSQFKIFRSSAGSGKTYQLALEYLKLALRYPDHYRKLLAVTFTNKATNEMKARIIEYLSKVSAGNADSEMVSALCESLGYDKVQLKEKARLTLQAILHGYSYFSVSTIDSFFQKVVSSFAKDLGIQGGYTLEFELKAVLEEVIDQLFMDLDKNVLLKNWLVEFTESKIEENKSWDVRYDIRKLAGQIYNEGFYNFYEELSTKIKDIGLLSDVLNKVKKNRARYNESMRGYGVKGIDFIDNSELAITDFFQSNKGPAGWFEKLKDERPFDFSNSYIQNARDNVEGWYSKTSKNKEKIEGLLQEGLMEVFNEAAEFYEANFREQNSLSEVQKFYYNLGIFSNLVEKLKNFREENEVILISDLAHLLKTIVGENDAPFVYEKVGSFYNHFLIDEFQDTSGFQWNNFRPLVINSLSQGYMDMLVGDVKQSIYRWRGGDWEIFQAQVAKDIGDEFISNIVLDKNWRSSKNIIYFNNTLFSLLPELFKEKYLGEIDKLEANEYVSQIGPLADKFQLAYHDVIQKIPITRQSIQDGTVQIKFLENEEVDGTIIKWKEKVLPELIPIITSLRDKSFQLKDISILVRNKMEGRIIAKFLLDQQNNVDQESKYHIDVISSESLFLKASSAVNVVISFIRIVLKYDDQIAISNLYYYLNLLLPAENRMPYNDLFINSLSRVDQRSLNKKILNYDGDIIYEEYSTLPLTDLVEEIILLFSLNQYHLEKAYLLGLQNVILEYLQGFNNDLHSFIIWWEQEGNKKSIKPSQEQNAINILTIHQAKGLEFKNVIIPFCSWDIDHSSNNDNFIWVKSDISALKDIPYYPIKYSQSLAKTNFIFDYFDEKSHAYLDNLNLLYVAFTRAVEGLFVFAEMPDKSNNLKNVGDLILTALADEKIPNVPADTTEIISLQKNWDEQEKKYHLGVLSDRKDIQLSSNSYPLNDYDFIKWYQHISIRRQVDILAKDPDNKKGEKINYGLLLHDILSKIKYKDHLHNVLEKEVKAGSITIQDQKNLEATFHDLWESPKISNWFTEEWQVKTEVPILPKNEQVSRVDRVMIKGNKCIVVDYKTGSKRGADIKQVSKYKNLLTEMGYKEVEGYILYLETKELIEV